MGVTVTAALELGEGSMKMAAAKETVTKEIEGRMSAQEDTCPKEGGDITYYMDLISENLQQLLKHTHHSGQCRIVEVL